MLEVRIQQSTQEHLLQISCRLLERRSWGDPFQLTKVVQESTTNLMPLNANLVRTRFPHLRGTGIVVGLEVLHEEQSLKGLEDHELYTDYSKVNITFNSPQGELVTGKRRFSHLVALNIENKHDKFVSTSQDTQCSLTFCGHETSSPFSSFLQCLKTMKYSGRPWPNIRG